jgi:hypothetical protein
VFPGAGCRDCRRLHGPSRKSSTAGCVEITTTQFRITHPFHPRRGTEYQLVTRKLTWGEDRVFYHGPDGNLQSLLTKLTDVVTADAFEHVSAGRSAFRLDDLLELRRLLDRCDQAGRGTKDV